MPLNRDDPRLHALEDLCEVVPFVSVLVRRGGSLSLEPPTRWTPGVFPPDVEDFMSVLNLPAYRYRGGFFGMSVEDVISSQREACRCANTPFWFGRGWIRRAYEWTPSIPVRFPPLF